MSPTQLKILKRCCELQKSIAASKPEKWESWLHDEWADQREHGPRYKIGEWFGPMPERDRVHYRRCIKTLESQGFLTTWRRWGDRLTNVKLTEAGERIAKQAP